jgi:retinol dehydrogenase-12
MTKGEKARKDVLASARKSSPGKVEVWQLDMSEYSSVLAFGDRMKILARIDAFIANAGIDTLQFEQFQGYESTITVNVISTILVALLAIPKLRETSVAQSKPSHLVFTVSVRHIFAKHKQLSEPAAGQIFNSLNDKATADMEGRYYLSKLMEQFAVRQLALELSRSAGKGRGSVICNCVNPGWCKTELFRTNDGGLGGRIGLKIVGRSAESGGRTLVHAAVAGEETHGKYLSECRIKPEGSWVRSDEGARVEKRLWTELVDILEGIQPGVTKIQP